MPKFQDKFSEAALEEFITIEMNLEQEHDLGTAFYNAIATWSFGYADETLSRVVKDVHIS